MNATFPPVHFINLAYFFNLLYSAFFFTHLNSFDDLATFASTVWLFVSLILYIVILVLVGALVYYTMRLHQASEEDAKRYTTIHPEEAKKEVQHSRWNYIRELIESAQQSDWRTAIIEADIMLDELLTKLGYVGYGVGDKLRSANPAHFRTLEDAGIAHGVRNDIAHRGSAFELSDQVAYRTINHYENVFREFNAI
jgi:hypothetical protein